MKNNFSMQFPAIGENESFARNAVAVFIVALKPTVEQLNDVKTAVSEAVTNAVVHAYGDGGIIDLSACYDSSQKWVEITITDKGCGIESINEATKPMFSTMLDEERSGMGFTIMQTFMDEVKIESAVGSGTTIKMKKVFDVKS